MTNTYNKAKQELEILEETSPYTANVITDTLKKLLLQKPITDILNIDDEWMNESNQHQLFQHKRCNGLFKATDTDPYYIDAIVWKDDDNAFTGSVYIDEINCEPISSKQKVIFPFKPKTFNIEVTKIPITMENAKTRGLDYHAEPDGKCYYYVVKEPNQLKPVFKYYKYK